MSTVERPRRGARRRAGVVVAVGLAVGALAVTACDPSPGEGRIQLTGAVSGQASGPEAQCHGPGYYADEYGTWEWRGTVAGRATSVSVADLGSQRVALLDVDGLERYAAAQGTPGWSFELDDGVAHLDARFTPWVPTPGAEPIDVRLTLTCPSS